jgi:hypothetical protein
MNLKTSTALVIGVLCVLAVCRSRPAYGAPPADPCTLLTQPQVSAVLGASVGVGKRVAPTLCEWSAPGQPQTLSAKKVTVTLQDERAFAAAKTPVPDGRARITKAPVSDVGDEAVSGTSPAGTVLTVKKGSTVFVVHVYGFPVDQTKVMEKTLALHILSKL